MDRMVREGKKKSRNVPSELCQRVDVKELKKNNRFTCQ